MKTTVLFVPSYPYSLYVYFGWETLRLFFNSGAFAQVLPDHVVDDVACVFSDVPANVLFDRLLLFLDKHADALRIHESFCEQTVASVLSLEPEDLYDSRLVVSLEVNVEHHGLIPSLMNYLAKGG